MDIVYLDQMGDPIPKQKEPQKKEARSVMTIGTSLYLPIVKHTHTVSRKRTPYRGELKLSPNQMLFATNEDYLSYVAKWNKRKKQPVNI